MRILQNNNHVNCRLAASAVRAAETTKLSHDDKKEGPQSPGALSFYIIRILLRESVAEALDLILTATCEIRYLYRS